MAKLFENSGDHDQMLHSVVPDLCLHCLPITLLGFPDLNGLTFTTLLANSGDDKLMIFFLFFPENRI